MSKKLFLIIATIGLCHGKCFAQEPCTTCTTSCRPGGPPPVACWAIPSNTRFDIGYYVGGGCRKCGDERHDDEGTWGWDSKSILLPRAVVLTWCHCKRSQGGTGSYRTVGTNRDSTSSP